MNTLKEGDIYTKVDNREYLINYRIPVRFSYSFAVEINRISIKLSNIVLL